MAIQSNDIQYFATTNNVGGAITVTQVVSASLENVFPNFTSDEALNGVTKYACIYLKNNNGTDTMTAVKQWISQQTPSPTTSIKIGLGTSGLDGTEQSVNVDMLTAPTGVTFVTAADEANHMAYPDIPAGSHHAFWVEWTVTAGTAAIAIDNAIVTTKCDTPV